jgi:endonuclease/exonuclease/phosphatase family metal-dependent hydrolase
MRRRLTFFFLVLLTAVPWASASDRDATVAIMTQNMDSGTDETYVVAALSGLLPLPDAVDLTFAELQAGHLEQRAGLVAAQIADRKPDLVALQEATLWRIGDSPQTAVTPLYDQLQLLLAALQEAGTPYDVVATVTVTDQALPGRQLGALRFTDRDVLLVRSDLRPPGFHVSDVHTHLFDASFSFGDLQISAGWIAATVHLGNRHFRLVTTHLQSPVPGVPQATQVQMAQAGELLDELRNTTVPVVVCGDFNSDALQRGFIDTTPTVGLLQAAGYSEVWSETHGAGEPGLTWPYFLEDQFPPMPFFAPFAPLERIDLFFSLGMDVIGSELVLAPAPAGSMPPFGSDHAGVIAVFVP